MSGECDKCGEHATECKCEDMKELAKSMRTNLERQNTLMDKIWPWLGTLQVEDDDE